MGMFDWVNCYAPLPDGFNGLGMQSKDLDCTLAEINITPEGRLVAVKEDKSWEDLDYHGDFNFYGDEPVGKARTKTIGGVKLEMRDRVFHDYIARFTEGQLTGIRLISDDPPKP